jgi:hypothetical protein
MSIRRFARNSRLTAVSAPRNPGENSCTRCLTRHLSGIWRPGRAPQHPCRTGIWHVLASRPAAGVVRPIAGQRCDFMSANTPLSRALASANHPAYPAPEGTNLTAHPQDHWRTTGVHRISDQTALGISYVDTGSARSPRDEDQFTTGPVGCVTQIVHDESGRHQGIGDLVALPEAQRRL